MTMKQNIRRLPLPEGADACCSPAEALRAEADLGVLDVSQDRFARMCKALGHPARVKIVRLLLSVGTCVCGDIVEKLPLAQSTVSQHLKVLKDAGIVVGTIDGPRTCYCLDREALVEFKILAQALL
jgi:DNA-binding transcriptional ArsR family regulator